MPIEISESTGTISLSRWMKDREGGRRIPILKTLGSSKILCPVPELPLVGCGVSLVVAFCLDLETSPGTEDLRISSNSSCSAFISELCSISDNLNIFYNGKGQLLESNENYWPTYLILIAVACVLMMARVIFLCSRSKRRVPIGCEVVVHERPYLAKQINICNVSQSCCLTSLCRSFHSSLNPPESASLLIRPSRSTMAATTS